MPVATVKLADGRQVKLGRNPPPIKLSVVRFADHFNAEAATPPPAKVDYSTKAMDSLRRMYLNDQYGDCVIAGKYHQVGLWTGNDTGTAAQGTDQEVYDAYQTICGRGDNGCDIPTVLDYWKTKGLKFNGLVHKLEGYVSIDWTNKLEVQVAILLFGSLTLGINLPGDWTCTDCVWDVTNSRIVGGHDICTVGYDETGVQCSTWAGLVTITWKAFTSTNWLEECYAQLSADWYNDDRLAPNGVNADTLRADLALIGGGTIPPIDPGPPPPPPPSPTGNGIQVVTTLAPGFYPIGTSPAALSPAEIDGLKAALALIETILAEQGAQADQVTASILKLVRKGVPWAQIWAWIMKYGLPLLLQLLPIILGGGFSGLTPAQIIAWITAALAALAGGQPLPPLPTP